MNKQDLKYLVLKRLYGVARASRAMGCEVGTDCRILSKIVTTEPWLVSVGNHTTISSNVRIITHDGAGWLVSDEHGRRYRYARVSIGSDVFIGANTTILPGVQIGDRCVIGAGSVVTKSVPADTVAAGNPARVLGEFEDFHTRTLKWSSESDLRGHDYRTRVDSIADAGFRPELPRKRLQDKE